MPRARSPARDKAKELWLESGGEKLLKDIAAELGVSDAQIRKWKKADNWESEMKSYVTNQKGYVTNQIERKKVGATEKRSGNPNPVHKFSHHNNPSLLHGLRSKYLHQEQVEIIEAMEGLSVADQIWLQIEIKFSALLRMQQIMWVKDVDDHLSVVSGKGESTTYKVAFAHERYEAYIKAQTRAMAEYRNLVKQFLNLSHEADERRLKLEGMELDIEKKQVEIARIEAELEGDEETVEETIIVDDKAEMRRILEERAKINEEV